MLTCADNVEGEEARRKGLIRRRECDRLRRERETSKERNSRCVKCKLSSLCDAQIHINWLEAEN